MSDDGRTAVTVIAMLGSVFSPFYARARASGGRADPLAHVALNVAVYAPGRSLWSLTERGGSAVRRSADELMIGASTVRWEGDSLLIDVEERTAPFGRRLAGRIRLTPEQRGGEVLRLDAAGRHRWMPIAPHAHVDVVLTAPSPLRFSGAAYLDANHGDEALEEAFEGWTWARVARRDGAVVTYDVTRRDGTRQRIARSFARGGEATHAIDVSPIAETRAAATRWRMHRVLHGEPGAAPRVVRTLEDTPFYARSLIETRFFGERAVGTHEVLSLDRFRSGIVQWMLPFRMRRERA